MYWKRSQKKSPVQKKTDFPVGTFFHSPNGYFYVVGVNRCLRILNERVLESWNPHRVVEVSNEAVRHYRVSAKMKFRNGSLIHSLADGKIYLISQGKRRHVTSLDALEKLGADRTDVVSVSLNEIKLHELGEAIN